MPNVIPGGATGLMVRGNIDVFKNPVFTRGVKVMTIRTTIFLLRNPLFSHEGPDLYAKAFQHNRPFAKAGPYQTVLSAAQESQFRLWCKRWSIAFDPNAKIVDYDMRGFWLANHGTAVNPPHRKGAHFTDEFKTPYDTTFSKESIYATKTNPFTWDGDNLIDTRTGQVIFGDAPFKKAFVLIPQVIGRNLTSPTAAVAHFQQTGANYGWFDTHDHAQAYAERLHKAQMAFYLAHRTKRVKSRFRG